MDARVRKITRIVLIVAAIIVMTILIVGCGSPTPGGTTTVTQTAERTVVTTSTAIAVVTVPTTVTTAPSSSSSLSPTSTQPQSAPHAVFGDRVCGLQIAGDHAVITTGNHPGGFTAPFALAAKMLPGDLDMFTVYTEGSSNGQPDLYSFVPMPDGQTTDNIASCPTVTPNGVDSTSASFTEVVCSTNATTGPNGPIVVLTTPNHKVVGDSKVTSFTGTGKVGIGMTAIVTTNSGGFVINAYADESKTPTTVGCS